MSIELGTGQLYVSVIKDVFKPATGEAPEPDERSRAKAMAGYQLLDSIKILPGQDGEEIDFNALRNWCVEVQQLAADVDRKKITDQYIGRILAHSPNDKSDGAWPHTSVRRLIEALRSEDVERGLAIERINMRGVYSKTLDEGGTQERALAEQVRNWARSMLGFPRTAALLMHIGNDWGRQAEQEDIRMEQERLKW